jgi:hypothetical protein
MGKNQSKEAQPKGGKQAPEPAPKNRDNKKHGSLIHKNIPTVDRSDPNAEGETIQVQVLNFDQQDAQSKLLPKHVPDRVLTREDILLSYLQSLVSLFVSSERFAEIVHDEDVILARINAEDSGSRGHIFRNFSRLFRLLLQAKTADTHVLPAAAFGELVATIGGQLGAKDASAAYLFLLGQLQGFRLAYLEAAPRGEESLESLLREYLGKVASEGEANPVLLEAVVQSLERLARVEDEGSGELLERTERVLARLESVGKVNPHLLTGVWTGCQEVVFGTGDVELAEVEGRLVEWLRGFVREQLQNKEIDFSLCLPTRLRSQMCVYDYFPFIGSFTIGLLNITSLAFTRVVQYQVNVAIDGVPQGFLCVEHLRYSGLPDISSPDSLYPTLKDLARVVSEALDRSDLHHDKDCALVYQRADHLYVTSNPKTRIMQRAPTCDHNVMLAFERPDFYSDPNKLKVVVLSSTKGNHLELPSLLMCLAGDTTLEEFVIELLKTSRSQESSTNKDLIDTILSLLVASDMVFPLPSLKKKFEDMRSKKQITPKTTLKELVKLCSGHGSKVEPTPGETQIDLIIKFAFEDAVSLEFLTNIRREIRRQPIYLKAELTDIVQQLYRNYFYLPKDEIPERQVRMLLPAYLLVTLDTISRMIDVPYELNFSFLEDRRKELGLEIGSRYRAIGYIAQKKNGEHYTIYINQQKRGEVFCYKDDKIVTSPIHTLNPNKLKAVYFERRELDL